MNYVLLPLEKLHINITFGKTKENQYKGINIPLYYKRENKNVPLYIKVTGCVSPFGIKQNTEMYSNNVRGYSLHLSLENNYAEKAGRQNQEKVCVARLREFKTSFKSLFLVVYLFVFSFQGLQKRTAVKLSQPLPAPHKQKGSKTTRTQRCKPNSGNERCSGKASELQR